MELKEKHFGYLEYHVLDYCNLNCKGCFHYAPLANTNNIRSVEDFKKDCIQLKKILPKNHKLAFTLLGGEPLLHPNLLDFINESQQIIPVTKITTNGILLKTQSQEFFDIINKYNIIIGWSNYYNDLEIKYILETKVNNYEIQNSPRLTIKNLNFTSKYPQDIIKEHYFNCHKISNCYTLRDGYLYKCAWEAWSDYLVDYFDLKIPNYGRDNNRLNIYEAKSIDDINKFINTPSEFCNFCVDGDALWIDIPWGTSKKRIKEWVLNY